MFVVIYCFLLDGGKNLKNVLDQICAGSDTASYGSRTYHGFYKVQEKRLTRIYLCSYLLFFAWRREKFKKCARPDMCRIKRCTFPDLPKLATFDGSRTKTAETPFPFEFTGVFWWVCKKNWKINKIGETTNVQNWNLRNMGLERISNFRAQTHKHSKYDIFRWDKFVRKNWNENVVADRPN